MFKERMIQITFSGILVSSLNYVIRFINIGKINTIINILYMISYQMVMNLGY